MFKLCVSLGLVSLLSCDSVVFVAWKVKFGTKLEKSSFSCHKTSGNRPKKSFKASGGADMLYCDWAVRNLNSCFRSQSADVMWMRVKLWDSWPVSCLVSVQRTRSLSAHSRPRPSAALMPPSDSIIDHSVNPAEGRTYNNVSPKGKNTLLSFHVLPAQCWCVKLIREPKRRRWAGGRRRTQEVWESTDAMKPVKKSVSTFM